VNSVTQALVRQKAGTRRTDGRVDPLVLRWHPSTWLGVP
jgi:hypothetical protein